ncbi:hypothetical protein [Kaarinaea lacus]
MKKKFSLFSVTVAVVAMACCGTVLADEFKQLFTQKYKKEMLPELRLSKIDRYKAQGLSEAQINRELEALVNKAADCQFMTFQAYEDKYQQVAYNALLDGGTTEDASLRLNEALDKDVDKGNISAKEMSNRVKKAMGLYSTCVINSGLVDQ